MNPADYPPPYIPDPIEPDDLPDDDPLTWEQRDGLLRLAETIDRTRRALSRHDYNLTRDVIEKAVVLFNMIRDIIRVNRQDFNDLAYDGNLLEEFNRDVALVNAHILMYQ